MKKSIFLLQDGGTPLFVAAQCGRLLVAQLLVRHGARIDAVMNVTLSFYYFLTISNFTNSNKTVFVLLKDGATPLFVASQNGHLPLVRFLIAKGANVNHKRKVNNSILFLTFSISC